MSQPEPPSDLEEIFTAQEGRPRPRRWPKVVIGILVTFALLFGAGWLTTALMKVPDPIALYRLATTDPSAQGALFATHEVPAARTPRPAAPAAGLSLPATVPWQGGSIDLDDFLTRTHTRALVVLQDGALVEEWYAEGTSASTQLSSWSMAKSVISLLVGQAIGEGKLSEDDRMVDLLPDFRGGKGAYDQITVRDLLDMTAAIDVPESYNENWPFTGTARLFISTDLVDYLKSHRSLTDEPGTEFDYRSVETQMLALILARVEGRSVSDLLAERLWEPIGAEYPATWSLDSDDGLEKGFCCLNASARDFAKLGQLVLDGGQVDDTQVVPAAWISRISTRTQQADDGWGYAAQWWHVAPGPDLSERGTDLPDLTAIGIYGQYLHVSPTTGTVLVKLSDHGTEQDEQLTVDALRSIAADLGGQMPSK